ncbi:RagB/SusD family nutrient uptake outer membrane protein [Chitinophaga qingshengii]|uniref:RagB/SusD family nutrient uptake outer membrane protein n=1 Tax=Chitinophaga qingshengii TaxID=1569794 RepID=A0ABR7TQW6_9BACT|nr:RagB/SusD family nutrient uptake outer membrane protein [Chitinophaga qingshengii]MBC9932884.1 RagB/SusD family nutrient uptake outer membrane protein [Chitinophaga qingshengii]
MKKWIIYCLAGAALLTSSCNKFMDVTPKRKFIPKTVADLELFLNDVLLADASYAYNEVMTDDLAIIDAYLVADTRNTRSYLWRRELLKVTEDDSEWNNMYKYIYNCNLVLANLSTATDGTVADVNRMTAEAKIHRAYFYFNLVNLYGADYRAVSASTDPGVPVLLVPDLEAKTTRASVQTVYDQILKDLHDALAISELPVTGRTYVHPGKAAANALLARVYLYMGNYAGAQQAAEAALALNSTLLDYNTFSFRNPLIPANGINGKPLPENNPENLFSKTNGGNGTLARFMINPDLLSILGEKDLRYIYTFSRLDSKGKPITSPYPEYYVNSVNYSIGVPEMMLIKAECLARNNHPVEAVALLNILRQKRFKPADYTELTAATNDAALDLVLRERRLELLYHGLRWFDLKRLNRDPRFQKTLTRVVQNTTYTLPPNDPRYVLPIAPKIIGINPGILQNPR